MTEQTEDGPVTSQAVAEVSTALKLDHDGLWVEMAESDARAADGWERPEPAPLNPVEWSAVEDEIRAQGEDPDALVARAAESLGAWQATTLAERWDRTPVRPAAAEIGALPQEVKDELSARVWVVAARFGAVRGCPACDKVVRRIANGRDEGHACAVHGGGTPGAPSDHPDAGDCPGRSARTRTP